MLDLLQMVSGPLSRNLVVHFLFKTFCQYELTNVHLLEDILMSSLKFNFEMMNTVSTFRKITNAVV